VNGAVDIDRWDERLALVGSEDRAAVLLACVREATVEEGRALLAYWFNMCDALAPWAVELREEFRRCAPVLSDEAILPETPVRVYRGAWHDDDTAAALSWTLDQEKAEWFARYLTGMRAGFLGIRRDNATPVVFQGMCVEVLGFITTREEFEVVAGRVVRVEPIRALMSEEQTATYLETGVLPHEA
jgi:hypothetical protein